MKQLIFTLAFFTFCLSSCNKSNPKSAETSTPEETFTSGRTLMFVDESVQPISEALVEVFEAYYPNAKIQMIEKSETNIMNELFLDSVRLAIVPRDLSEKEINFLSQRVSPITTPIAREAVVFIRNNKIQDSLIKLDDLKAIINTENSKVKLIFDNINSSVVRLFKNTIDVDKDTPNTYFMPDTKKVIEYISKNQNAIGIISSNWLAQPDSSVKENKKHIHSLAVYNEQQNDYIYPTQSTIADKTYPLIRTINIIDIKGNAGLGKGFSAFAASDKGQRIILKSGLMPVKTPSREIIINNN